MKKFVVVVIFLLVAGSYFISSNIPILVQLAEFSGSNQSSFYIFCLERIYGNIDCDDDSYSDTLADSERYSDHTIWVRVLSVAGGPGAAEFIHQKLEEAVLSGKEGPYLTYYIKAASILGLQRSKELLMAIAKDKYQKRFDYVEQTMAISALYYLDGINYGKQFGNEYIVSDEMKMVREVIKKSEGRCRNTEEMLSIDSSYRPRK